MRAVVHRRDFVRSCAAICAGAAGEKWLRADVTGAPWRTFEVTTRVEILNPAGRTRVWIPTPLTETSYQRGLAESFVAEGAISRRVTQPEDSLTFLYSEFPDGVKPVVTVISRIATRDYSVDLSRPQRSATPAPSALQHFLQPTRMIPLDGIVKDTALRISKGAPTDVAKARAIYEWIVENTFRDPKIRGCGLGDIRFMLESGNLGGKCADLNALFVGLARACGLPARDAYGIRVAKSKLGYKSLGASSDVITKAQHCRAEVFLDGYGWVPMDPADVRKVALEEPPGNRALNDDLVMQARTRLFGSWEMNWMAYNFAGAVNLPGSAMHSINFFMYPQAETADGRIDCLNPDEFKYEIRAVEIDDGR
jgi:transglutaminase-like putative cysteine protease